MTKQKHWGDRRDATLVRDIDPIHFFTPYLFPHRTANEAYVSETIDLTNLDRYLEQKNVASADRPYTLFHAVLFALVKTCVLRPKLNRFIKNNRIYERDAVTASFVVKKRFADEAKEALAWLSFDRNDTMDSSHAKLMDEIYARKREDIKEDSSTDSMATVMKLPRPLVGFIAWVARRLDEHGHVPYAWVATDPYHATVIISNLGSIKMKCGYHHLADWGTNSVFCIIGEKRMTPVYDEKGAVSMRATVELGLTIDERIADGYYYSRSIHLLKRLLEDPELLDRPASEEVDY